MSALDAVARRRSHSKVTDDAPSDADLARFVASVATVADHSGLRPWRVIALRGDARERLGKAFAKASKNDADKYIAKAMRAPLLIAIVARVQHKHKVPVWEQEAVASGVAHLLSLVLDEAGWGVIWRTGELTRTKAVHEMHGLDKNEYLLGWLYVGGIPSRPRNDKPRKVDVSKVLTTLD